MGLVAPGAGLLQIIRTELPLPDKNLLCNQQWLKGKNEL
jgi:hypothetical protein